MPYFRQSLTSDPFVIIRRALLLLLLSGSVQAAPYEITDSFGKHWFERPPQRVVVTDWTLLDNLQALGVETVGAPELALYRQQVSPDLPRDVTDIGLRAAPNLETLRQLKPDVILLGTGQKELARPLSRISTVLYFKQFSDRYRSNGLKSRERYLQLAAVFRKTTQAEQQLKQQDTHIQRLKDALAARYSNAVPPVTLLQIFNDKRLRLYGPGSLPGHALQSLGLEPGLQRPAEHWGESYLKLGALAETTHGPVLLFAPQAQHTSIRHSRAWQSLPGDVRERIKLQPPLWPYGGALSIGSMAQRIADALL